MTEQELRALVRSVIAQRAAGSSPVHGAADVSSLPGGLPIRSSPMVTSHASHALFVLPAQGEACLIEPAVACNHCGYCKSYGH